MELASGIIELTSEIRSGQIVVPIPDDEFTRDDSLIEVFATREPNPEAPEPQLLQLEPQTTITVVDDDSKSVGIPHTVGPVLNAWFNDCVLRILPTLLI